MANISKADLVDKIAEETGLNKSQSKDALEAVLGTITTHLEQGDKVTLTGFGTFEVRERSAREGVKPGTSEKIQIPASKYPAFKAGKTLKESVKQD